MGLAFSPSGKYIVAIASHKAYIASSTNLEAGFTKYVSPERLTCLSFHPSEDYFATGDEKGVIRLWYCLGVPPVKAFGIEKRTQTSALHWHSHSVTSLSFSTNGAYLLSGGTETVLVVWQLHTGRKEFVPRVGAPIKSISVTHNHEGEEWLLTLSDAALVFVHAATLQVSRSFSQIKLGKLP
jgi:NET1-associated nuclear protein 1 (U3 small nucleolar RNA-associated protein 17)